MLHAVDVELTPNPQALKFLINEKLLYFGSRQFNSKSEAESDALAKGIFEIEGVVSVFYMDRFITIEKTKDTEWGKIQKPFVNFITAFDKKLIPEEKAPEGTSESDNIVLKKVIEVLDKKVRPALANDGGGVEVLGLTANILRLRYQGACGSCPSAINGTLSAIERLLKQDVNPAISVVAD